MHITEKLKDLWNDFINFMDTPFDKFKHFWHGLEVCIYDRKYKCSAYMASKPDTTSWSIKRIDEFDPTANRHIRIWCKDK